MSAQLFLTMESRTRLGYYEISTFHGKGGMAEVWRATSNHMNIAAIHGSEEDTVRRRS